MSLVFFHSIFFSVFFSFFGQVYIVYIWNSTIQKIRESQMWATYVVLNVLVASLKKNANKQVKLKMYLTQ